MYYVYMLSNQTNTVLYTGITNDLIRRVWEHKHETNAEGFTARYHVHRLVHYEETADVYSALTREKQIKSWNRKRKNKLIETTNPHWDDLYASLLR